MALRPSSNESGFAEQTPSSSGSGRTPNTPHRRLWGQGDGKTSDSTTVRSSSASLTHSPYDYPATGTQSDSLNVAPEDVADGGQLQPNLGVRLPSCRQMCYQRVPKGRVWLLVVLLIVFERFVFIGAVNGILQLIPDLANSSTKYSGGFGFFLRIFLLYCIGRLFYPVGGFLADVYLGRYRMIHISLWLYWVAFALLAIANTLHILSSGPPIIHKYILPLISYVCIIPASGGFQSTIIPFGADQLEAASSSELSSYFYWYYFAIQFGGAPLNVPISYVISLLLPSKEGALAQIMIALTVVSLGLVLHNVFRHWYFKNIRTENCVKLVTQVSWYAATVRRHMPQYRRAFRYGEEKVSRIELAKMQYDGKFSGDQVEDVKTFCRICLILFTFGGFFFSMNGGYAMLSYRLNETLSTSIDNSNLQTFLFPNIYALLNTLTIMLTLPLVNHFLVPCVPSMTLRERMGIGMTIIIVALSCAAYLEWAVADTTPLHQALWFILPSILLSLQETFTVVSALEFIYAQSPESMKGMLIGLFYFTEGIYSGGMSAVFFEMTKISTGFSPFCSYYIFLLVFMILAFAAYVLVASLYVNHQRPLSQRDMENDVTHLYNNIVI